MDSYLEAINENQGCYVTLDKSQVWVSRARFGLHLQLGRLAEEINDTFWLLDVKRVSKLMADYLIKAGLDPDLLAKATTEELIETFRQIQELNELKWILLWMEHGAEPEERKPYEYRDRNWAWIVHKIASRYGWGRDEILNRLWPEEAMTYIQEIQLSEFDELENRRALSELAYRYDPNTKKSTYHPMPRPDWMVPRKPERTVRIRRDMLPVGNVIDLSGKDTVH